VSDNLEGPSGDFERALGLMAMGQYGTAVPILEGCARESPDRPEVWTALAQAQVASGDDLGGLESAQCAIALRPEGPSGYHLASVALMTMNRSDEAEHYARRAIEIVPNWSDPHRWLAEVLLTMKGRSDDALEAASEAVRLAPHDPRTHLTFAKVLIKLRKSELARTELLTALSLEPGLNTARELLATIDRGSSGTARPSSRSPELAEALAETLRQDPSAALAAYRLNHVIVRAYDRAMWILSVGAIIGINAAQSQTSGSAGSRLWPAVMLVVAVLYEMNFLKGLRTDTRAHVMGLVRHLGQVRAALILGIIGACLVVVQVVAPFTAQRVAGFLACVLLVAGRVVLNLWQVKLNRCAQKEFGTSWQKSQPLQTIFGAKFLEGDSTGVRRIRSDALGASNFA
jgi:tetratricopeptide (TPR) repeat protein